MKIHYFGKGKTSNLLILTKRESEYDNWNNLESERIFTRLLKSDNQNKIIYLQIENLEL